MKFNAAVVVAAACATGALAASSPMVGTNPCTYGPSFWCASKANADKCDFDVSECSKYCDNAKEYPDIQKGDICSPPAVGSDKCTQGPSYFCASSKNAKQCGVTAKDCKKYCTEEYEDVLNGPLCKSKPAPVGSNKCTQGPSYFCASVKNAKQCGVAAKDCKKYCTEEYEDVLNGPLCKSKPAPVGSNKCTQGPSYFCASAKNAKQCGVAVKDCKKYCTDEYKDVLNGELCKEA